MFDNEIRKRGNAYFLQRRVTEVKIEEEIATAVVLGSQQYKVQILFDDSMKPKGVFCTCPYFETANCKHLAAFFYKLNTLGIFSPFYFNTLAITDNSISSSLQDIEKPIPPALFTDSIQKENELTRKEKQDLWKAEIKRREEEALFNEFKNKISALLPGKSVRKNKTKYKLAYAIQLNSFSVEFHLLRQRLNVDGTVADIDFANSINFENFEPVPFEEKIIVELLRSDYYHRHYSFGNSNYGNKSNSNNHFIDDVFRFLSEREVYLYGSYLTIKERIYILKTEGHCELFITEDADNIYLQLGFFVGEEKIHSNTKVIPALDNPLWVFAKDKIFRVANLRYEQFQFFIDREGKIAIPKSYLQYFEKNVLPQIASDLPIVSDKYSVETVNLPPSKKIFLEETNGDLTINLKFGYGEIDVPFDEFENASLMIDEKKIIKIQRDKNYESLAREEITSTFVKEISPGVFVPRNNPIDFLFNYMPRLMANGFEILGESNLNKYKINTSTPKIKFAVSSGIDWFDLETNIDFDGVGVSYSELIEALKNKKRYIKLSDNSVGVLPEEWVKKLKTVITLGEVNEQKVRFSKIQASALDAILADDENVERDANFIEQVNKLQSFTKITKQTLPKNFNGELREYQKSGLNWLYFLKEFSFGGILADDMGLGKTIEVLSLLAKEKKQKSELPSLIVAPTSVVFNWINEAKRFVPSLVILNHTGNDRIKEDATNLNGHDVILTSYGILLRDFDLFLKQKFHYIILDESQKIKNPISKTARLVRQLNANNKLCLTGTPVENNLNELWSQMTFLNPGLLGSLNKFQTAFTKPIQKESDQTTSEILKRTIYPFVLRRTKELVAKELPPKTEMIHYCEMDNDQSKFYNLWKESIRYEVLKEIEKKGIKKSGFKVLEGLLRLRQICNHPSLVDDKYKKKSGKFEEFKEMVLEIVNEGHKVLVFSQFVQMLEIIRKFLDSEKIEYEYLTGSTKDREGCVTNFQTNDGIKIFLISLKAGGFGLNLTAADYVFHYDPWWNPAVEAQATDRTHRIGQTKNVFVYKFITKGTVEEKILLLQERKRTLVENIISSEAGVFKNLTKEDIELLFE